MYAVTCLAAVRAGFAGILADAVGLMGPAVMKKRANVTMHDIARIAGVSAMTVSRALSGHPDVNEDKRRRIIDIAEGLKYRPNRLARFLITNESFLIGVIVPDISQPFFCDITRGVQEVVSKEGYDLVLCHSGRDADQERREIDMLLARRVDALLIASEQRADNLDVFQELEEQGVPYVLVDRRFVALDCPCVRTDDREAGRLATEHLISLGHRRIAHVGGPDVSTGIERLEGYVLALKQAGIPVREELIERSNFKEEGGRQAMAKFLQLPERPTAVFTANAYLGFGAVQACYEAGLQVPRDISFVGAGDIEPAQHPNPFLTTVVWDRREMGQEAGGMLLKLLADKPLPKRQRDVVIPPRLTIRHSARPLSE